MEISIAFPIWVSVLVVLLVLGHFVGLTLGKTKYKVRLYFKGGSHLDFWTEKLTWTKDGGELKTINWHDVCCPTLEFIDLHEVAAITVLVRKRSVWSWFTNR